PVLPRKLEAAEIALLLRRADEVMAKGDLAAARLLLQRVAETKNARAAFQLGSTYDPTVIKKFANNSIAADPALAQFWYERARDWGSPDAAGPLEALASHAVGKWVIKATQGKKTMTKYCPFFRLSAPTARLLGANLTDV